MFIRDVPGDIENNLGFYFFGNFLYLIFKALSMNFMYGFSEVHPTPKNFV